MLDVGSTLFERLDAALLCMRKLRCKDFKRQPRDPATNPPITVVHKEIYVVGRELVVPRVDCGRQWHGFRLLGSTAVLQTIARLLRSWKTSWPQSSHNTAFLRPTPLSRGTIMSDSGNEIMADGFWQVGLWQQGSDAPYLHSRFRSVFHLFAHTASPSSGPRSGLISTGTESGSDLSLFASSAALAAQNLRSMSSSFAYRP